MIVSKKLIWGTSLSLLALAACDGGGGLAAAQNQFGRVFSTAYAASSTSVPVTPITQTTITFKGVTGPDPTAFPVSL